ncbi:MAG: radical SAM protein [Acidobacteria bacterium]|nr:radical SAM protein [Acidobacteriota bacterium]
MSTYDMGRQPFGLASAAGALGEQGVQVTCLDLAKQRLDEEAVRTSSLIAFFLPMHTATRLSGPVIDRVRLLNPSARLCAYGLYAPLNAGMLRERGITDIIGGEFEDALADLAAAGTPARADTSPGAPVPRVRFRTPVRDMLPPLTEYATLQVGEQRRTAGYTEASRGCKHRCRHCPVVPVYNGRFRVVPPAQVISDVRAQVAAGAQHVTFGDPDFFNGPRHATDVLRAFAAEFPGVTYDVTIKVEHLLRHADLLPPLRDTGCLFVTSAVESIDDEVLARLEKGHTRADFERAVALCRAAGVSLRPTFVAFTPWTTLEGYCELLRVIDHLGLVEHVAPIQLAIRLLITNGSRLLELEEVRSLAPAYSPASLTYPWRHPDPEVDCLQRHVEALVGRRIGGDRRAIFRQISQDAHAAARLAAPRFSDAVVLPRAAIPYLNEPWYC